MTAKILAIVSSFLLVTPLAGAQGHRTQSQSREAAAAPKEISLADALVFTDSQDFNWYQLNLDTMSLAEAKRACQKRGLDLPSSDHVVQVKSELSATAKKDKRLQRSAWTSTAHATNPDRSVVFTITEEGLLTLAHAGNDNYGQVLCVGKK